MQDRQKFSWTPCLGIWAELRGCLARLFVDCWCSATNLVNSSMDDLHVTHNWFLPLHGFPCVCCRNLVFSGVYLVMQLVPCESQLPMLPMSWGEERWYKAREVGQHWWWCRAPSSAMADGMFFLTATDSIQEFVNNFKPYHRIIDLLAIIVTYELVFVIVNDHKPSSTPTRHRPQRDWGISMSDIAEGCGQCQRQLLGWSWSLYWMKLRKMQWEQKLSQDEAEPLVNSLGSCHFVAKHYFWGVFPC